MTSEYYASWVERHKFEDDKGLWWWAEGDDLIEGPFDTEEELDELLWNAVLAGDAMPGA